MSINYLHNILQFSSFVMWNKVVTYLFITFHVLAIAMFALPITVCEILTVEMCMSLTLTFRISQYQM